jgi:hypothetical protein
LLFDEDLAAGVVDQAAVVAGLAGIGDLGEVAAGETMKLIAFGAGFVWAGGLKRLKKQAHRG